MFEGVGHLISIQRKKHGLSRVALAQKAGVGKTVVYDIENGKTTVQFDTLTKVLNALEIQVFFRTPQLNIAFKDA